MADKLSSGIFIAEILADNAGGSAIDTDGDGRANKADEYVELQNTSGTTISLDGYEIWSQQQGLLYAFEPGATIDPGGTATVLGEYTGTPPPGFYDAGGSRNSDFLLDGQGSLWDNIYLVDTNTGEFVVLGYGLPPRPISPPPGFPGTTQIGAGESINSGAPNGRAIARDSDGTLIETDPTPGTPNVPCFVAGTRIATETGDVPVENLRPGDRVVTLDHGAQPLLAVRTIAFSRQVLRLHPNLRPVCLEAADRAPLVLSPAHRVLLKTPLADLLYAASEVLVPAHILAAARSESAGITRYFHLLFDRHEIVFANGWPVESLYTGELTRGSREGAGWRVAEGIDLDQVQHVRTARPVLKRHEAVPIARRIADQDGLHSIRPSA